MRKGIMKKFVTFSLAVAVMVSAFVFLPAPSANAQIPGLVSSAISRMEKNKRSLKSMRANITMEKYNSQLRDTDKYQGIVLYIPGGGGNSSASVRLEWTSPKHEIMVSSNGNYTAYQPRLGQVFQGKTSRIKSERDSDVLALINMSAAQLRSKFGEFQDVREETLWGGVWTQHFKAMPNGPASYQYIEVWVDKDGMPVMTKMVEKNGDATTVRLSDVQRNTPIPMDQFKIDLPANVKIIKG
jgi:outer membrane lipoprotein-sorting protein